MVKDHGLNLGMVGIPVILAIRQITSSLEPVSSSIKWE